MSYPHSHIVHFFSGIILHTSGLIQSLQEGFQQERLFFVTDPILESPWKNEVGE